MPVIEDAQKKLRDDEIEKSRNKSGLYVQHRNILHERNPYLEPQLWHHKTVKYVRKIYGLYGAASNVNPSICWPLKEELNDKKEYERVAFPHTISQMIGEAKKIQIEKEERKLAKQRDIVEKMKKLEQWKQEFYDRMQKKENEIKAAKVNNH